MASRRPITTISWHVRREGSGRLFASTDEKVFVLDPEGGNWTQVLALEPRPDYLGFGERHFELQSVGNVVFISNPTSTGYVYLPYENPEQDDAGNWQYAKAVADLIVLGVTEIGCSASLNGFTFIANVTMEGEKLTSTILWSDFNNPQGWIPGAESLAGTIDLGQGQTILRMIPLGEQLIVYTDQGIYAATLAEAPEIWRFRTRYTGPDVPLYPRAVISSGEQHLYPGKNNLFLVDTRVKEPQRFEWLDNAGGALYKGVPPTLLSGLPDGVMDPFKRINESACYAACGGYDARRKLFWLSWAVGTESNPSVSLVINPFKNAACIYDYGFTAFASAPTGIENPRQTFRGWMHSKGICAATVEVNEGSACGYGPFDPMEWDRIYHTDELHPEFLDANYQPKDSTADSWCFNEGEMLDCIPCEGEWKFIMASAVDLTLKEYVEDFVYREVTLDDPLNLTPPVWCNQPFSMSTHGRIDKAQSGDKHPTIPYDDTNYARLCYATMWQTDATKMGSEMEAIVAGVRLHGSPHRPEGEVPSHWPLKPWWVNTQIATGQTASCSVWADDDPQEMCLPWDPDSDGTEVDPTEPIEYRFNERGLYGVARWWVAGEDCTKNVGIIAMNALTISIVNGTCKWV